MFCTYGRDVLCELRKVKKFLLSQPCIKAMQRRVKRIKMMLLFQVLAYEPDIVCFQEVPPDYYDRKFKPHFDKLGFEGVYMKRVAKTHHEGEATFFK